MKKYVVFMFCLMFAVSFVACDKKDGASRQLENSDKKEDSNSKQAGGAGHTSVSQGSSLSDPGSSPSPDATDNFVFTEGDQVILTNCTVVTVVNSVYQYDLTFEFTRDSLKKEVSIQVPGSGHKIILCPIIDMDNDRKMYMYITSTSSESSDTLAFFSFANSDSEHKCVFVSNPDYIFINEASLAKFKNKNFTFKKNFDVYGTKMEYALVENK
jgi:hypothetical protein